MADIWRLGLANDGLRIFDRDEKWAEVFRDTDYGDDIYGVAFAADGRLATTSRDGMIRLYDSGFRLVVPPKNGASGNTPFGIAFSPDGAKLAVGYDDVAAVDLFDGQSLAPLPGPNLDGLAPGGLAAKSHGRRMAPSFLPEAVIMKEGAVPFWPGLTRGEASGAPCRPGTIIRSWALRPCQMAASWLQQRTHFWRSWKPTAAFAGRILPPMPTSGLNTKRWQCRRKARLSISALNMGERLRCASICARANSAMIPPLMTKPSGRSRTGFLSNVGKTSDHPTLDGQPIALEPYESSRSLAVHPDGSRFVLGTEWYLRAYNAKGELLWRRDAPGAAWAVNIAGDGRLVVAAYGDGTIRWHRMDDGRELLALYVLADKQNWVAWTPEGFYGATPGAFGVLRWHVNRGFDAAAETVPVSDIPKLRRPDALPFVLQELETARALGIADMKAARRDVQIRTGAAKAPGARLHVLAIGVSDYGEKAAGLALKFAHKDAEDVASALLNTQGGGLYAEVLPMFLGDGAATKAGIFEALAAMERNMARGGGQDMAVVMFSGHGAVMDGQFYLVPHGVDNGTKASLKASAIPASEFQREILNLSRHGRVLVLLDACRSAGLIDGAPGASLLSSAVAAGNVTVLTSSKADKLSREDEAWQHGAFTKVLLDALSDDDIDTDQNGVISMTDLTAYMEKRLDLLTGGDQQLGVEQRFQGEIFVVGL